MSARHLRDPDLLVRHGRPGRDVAEVFLNFLFRGYCIDVAGQHHDDIRWSVVALEPLLHILHRRRIQVRHFADHLPGIWMRGGISVFGDIFFGQRVGLVFILPLLVLHHPALQVERLLAEVEKAHAVGFHPKGKVERGGGNIFKIVGAVKVGSAGSNRWRPPTREP